jgi:hypothetical protein
MISFITGLLAVIMVACIIVIGYLLLLEVIAADEIIFAILGLAFLGIVFGITALVTGGKVRHKGYGRTGRKERNMGKTGEILGLVGTILCGIALVLSALIGILVSLA